MAPGTGTRYGLLYYDDPEHGDFWLKTSDGDKYRVSKEGLSKVSVFFRDMFGIQQPSGSADGTEAIPLSISETGLTLDVLFPFALQPRRGWEIINRPAVWPLEVADICGDAIVAAEKYQFEPSIAQEIIFSLAASEKFTTECPAVVYGLACRYGTPAAITLAAKAMMNTPFASMALGRHAAAIPISAYSGIMALQNNHINDTYNFMDGVDFDACGCDDNAGSEWARLLADKVKLSIEATPSGENVLTLGMLEEVLSGVNCDDCPANLALNLGELHALRERCVYRFKSA